LPPKKPVGKWTGEDGEKGLCRGKEEKNTTERGSNKCNTKKPAHRQRVQGVFGEENKPHPIVIEKNGSVESRGAVTQRGK